ncbi:MAG: LysR family transcriptional regulator [Proteobacteria bacterium]|nr:LysR family transcriptional regulator [Pseudomonadota bacterium]
MASYTKGHRPDSFIRVHLLRVNAIGPGKADLLEVIAETGSIAAAARRMRMSYRRAWSLVQAMNGAFRAPLVETMKGGSSGGGTALTATGKEVLKQYRDMESRAADVIAEDVVEFKKLIRHTS